MDASHVYVRACALDCLYSHISTRTFQRALTASVDSCAEIKSAPSVAKSNLAEFGGRRRKAMLGVWNCACDVEHDEQQCRSTGTVRVTLNMTNSNIGLQELCV